MPDTATPETSASTETFGAFRSSRGTAAPAVVEVKVENPADTGSTNSAVEDKGRNAEVENKTAGESETPQQQDKVSKRKSEIQREIDELVARREALKREVGEKAPATAGAATGEKGATKITADAPAATYDGTDPKDPAPKKPDQKDAKYAGDNAWEQYQEDLLQYAIERAKWETRRDSRVENYSTQLAKQQAAHKEALAAFEDRGSEFATEHADYPELVEKFKSRNISNETAAVIVKADNGPAILYELMTNPEELKRIESLPTVIDRLDALYELKYKLREPAGAAKGETEKTAVTNKPKSAAPAVGTRVNGTGGGGSKEPSTFAGFRKAKFG